VHGNRNVFENPEKNRRDPISVTDFHTTIASEIRLLSAPDTASRNHRPHQSQKHSFDAGSPEVPREDQFFISWMLM
jgi:hypothetical protein